MSFGTVIDEKTSFAILDRYVEAGGTFIDTANSYAFWNTGGQGGESEALLGRWRRSRGVGDEIVIATKLGGRPASPGAGFERPEGLSARIVRESAWRSREQLGIARLDLLYAHLEDPAVPVEETVGAFAELVAEGTVGLLGVSNHGVRQVARARDHAAALGLPGFEVLQYHHTYLRQRVAVPDPRSAGVGQRTVDEAMLEYVRANRGLALTAYTPLLSGAYTRPEKPLNAEYDHRDTVVGLSALRAVADEAEATVNQVVLAWLLGGEVSVLPIVGVSTVAQLDENLAAVDLDLTSGQRARLNAAR
jgi:aryl-alcohol dehydrogenase-like predicted oxidoreductase